MARVACTIIVAGQLDGRFRHAFHPFTVTAAGGTSQFIGTVADQAELQGLLRQLFDLGLEVVSFTADVKGEQPGSRPESPG
jgi:hypothetical protein